MSAIEHFRHKLATLPAERLNALRHIEVRGSVALEAPLATYITDQLRRMVYAELAYRSTQ